MKKLHYKDVVLGDPVYSDIRSRDDVYTEVNLAPGYYVKSPLIPSNMVCAISFEKAKELYENGYFYILHRFYDYDEIYDWIKENHEPINISISIGVKEKDYDFVERLSKSGFNVDFITIDIAYGHSVLMKDMIHFVKDHLPKTKIIAGNICTPHAVKDLEDWGADFLKVGISGGFSCRTYNSTGVGSPMFTTIYECANVAKVPIIADGGVRDTSDICKALVAGATFVMCGTKFVECEDSPAPTVSENGDFVYKEYFGSASARNKGHGKYVEGSDCVLLPMKDYDYYGYYDKVDQGIRSCMSYHNIRNIKDMVGIKWSEHNSEFDQNLDRYVGKK